MIGKTNSQVGSSEELVERVNIQLKTNQSSHEDIIGATFTVSYGSFSELFVWDGSVITVTIPAYVEYTITFNSVTGYTPDTTTFKATSVAGNSQSVTVTYQTEIVSVSLTSSDDGDISGATVTINGTSFTWLGTTITHKVAYGTVYSITCGSVSGYGTPTAQTNITANSALKSYTFEYILSQLKINISSNQSNDTTIAAVKATVTYGNTSVLVPNGLTVSIPADEEVTVSFPNVTGYSINSNNLSTYTTSFTNTTGGVKTVTATYRTCSLTVEVVGSGATPSGYSVKIMDATTNTALYTQTTSSATYKIALGYTIAISANSISGFNAPSYSTQVFAVDSSSKTVTVTYVYNPEIANGIYICDKNGKCYSASTTSVSNAVGVVIKTDNCCFIMDLKYTGGIPWMSSSYTGYNEDIASVPSSTSSTTIAENYNGYTYTNSIIEYAQSIGISSSNNCAAWYARSNGPLYQYSFTIDDDHLGSAGEWQAVIDNYSTVQTALTNAGGFTIDWDNGTFYWTSCEYNGSFAWYAGFRSSAQGLDYGYYKYRSDSYYCVVAFCNVDKSKLTTA